MNALGRVAKSASFALAALDHLSRKPVFLLTLLLYLVLPQTNSAEILYFCSQPQPIASGPWSIDLDVNGTPDLDIAVAGQTITVLPAIGNSVLATNRSYYTNIPPLTDPVLVVFPDEVASLGAGVAVPFFNPSRPFWLERRDANDQPLTFPMIFPSQDPTPIATNYFAMKVHRGTDWVLAWVRVRLTSGNDGSCALDWGYETRQTPLRVDEIRIGSRPSPATILSVDKLLGIPLFGETGIDLDADGATDVSFGGTALVAGGPDGGGLSPSSGTLSYGLTMTGQNEVLRDDHSSWILPTGGGIADFVPSGTFWAGGGAGLVFRGLVTNSIWIGHLAEATNGYMGVRIYKDNDPYYGWIHLQLSNQMIDSGFGPAILGWAIESRPQVPIVAGARGVGGEVFVAPPMLVGNLCVVNVCGLSRSNIVLSSSQDLIQWTPFVTNSVPFNFVYPLATQENARYFRAAIGN